MITAHYGRARYGARCVPVYPGWQHRLHSQTLKQSLGRRRRGPCCNAGEWSPHPSIYFTLPLRSTQARIILTRDDEAPRGVKADGPTSFQGKTRAGGASGFSVNGGIRRASAAAGGNGAGTPTAAAFWQCLPAEQWPGGPAVRVSGSMSGCCPEDGALVSCRVLD